ncbi:glutamate 5-kinase [Tilletiaria anomala UBC 951]|uniref:Glutamate 5-kinase n=1 Tax=Tilletiaria anomala (strain ATCC 24038 / CBS 436.72 / UBC 951) TaxID=1037660 RepID=A0A066WDS3_TILAU|nr:glutamate 5-kinase [Tilletiaria anomala UBC 951]KDN48895.1 glutamate 5-kinase [Tilletiaria anomala UBC 951]
MVVQQASPINHAGPSSRPGNAHPAASTASKTVVIKLGTSSILSESTFTPRLSILSSLVETCHALRQAGHKVLFVCSGAIGMGRVKMDMGKTGPPKSVGERQALAAIGQCRLMALWDSLFSQLGLSVAQVLLTKYDIADRARYRNARTTLLTLLNMDIIPIVNENDTVSVSELRFGDNDTLSAITAALVDAHYLFLCTDVDGLYTANPRSDPNARRLGVVSTVSSARKAVHVASMGSNFGTGGMQTKLIAAELATAAGVATVILNGMTPSNIVKIIDAGIPAMPPKGGSANSHAASTAIVEHPSPLVTAGDASGTSTPGNVTPDALTSSVSSLSEDASQIGIPPLSSPPHTLFLPHSNPLPSRKWSILHAMHPSGSLIMDEGAYRAITRADSGGRLLPAGVIGVAGNWERMQAVRLVVRRKRKVVADTQTEKERGEQRKDEKDVEDVEIGRGLANYTSIECERIKGLKSSQIAATLGFADSDYLTDQIALHNLQLEDNFHE